MKPTLVAAVLLAVTAVGAIIGVDSGVTIGTPRRTPSSGGSAESTVALIPSAVTIGSSRRHGIPPGRRRADLRGDDELCPGVRFREQLAPAYCSGFLVGSDLVVTAAHCVPEKGCPDMQLVFDLLHEKEGRTPRHLAAESVYSCKEIAAISKEEDWVVLRLDRVTKGREFFSPSRRGASGAGNPACDARLPAGIPLKIGDGAKVVTSLHSDEENYFEADLSTFGGNSGGPVVNGRTYELEGILAVGFGEFEDPEVSPETGKPCKRPRHIKNPDDATPSWVVRAPRFARAVRDAAR